jgi:hypothetical protein
MTQQVMSTDDFLANYLEHHGVKGMKWGHRRANVTGAEIKDARNRTVSRANALNAQGDKFNLTKPGTKAHEKEGKKLNQMNVDFLNHPDRATAMRLTKGEKAGLIALSVLFPVAGTTASVAAGSAQLGVRKSIEKKQRSGAFNNVQAVRV